MKYTVKLVATATLEVEADDEEQACAVATRQQDYAQWNLAEITDVVPAE